MRAQAEIEEVSSRRMLAGQEPIFRSPPAYGSAEWWRQHSEGSGDADPASGTVPDSTGSPDPRCLADCHSQYLACLFSPALTDLRLQIASTSNPFVRETLQEALDVAEEGCSEAHSKCRKRCSRTPSPQLLPDWLSQRLSLLKRLARLEGPT